MDAKTLEDLRELIRLREKHVRKEQEKACKLLSDDFISVRLSDLKELISIAETSSGARLKAEKLE